MANARIGPCASSPAKSKSLAVATIASNPSERIALNPQPLPPKVADLARAHAQLGKTELATSELQHASLLDRAQGDLGTAKASQSAIIIASGRH